jgi:hypothetical protein
MPYLLRDQINWSSNNPQRWKFIAGLGVVFGGAILACAVLVY